jgi:NAD(P)-dependent dehydrogenase (short-subunit alcohol dehydrogenase family)
VVPFAGRLVLVTGATGPLGTEMVRAFLAMGARVAAAARRRTGLSDLRAAMGGSDRLDVCEADVGAPDLVENLFGALERGTGPVHAVVQCAGAFAEAPIVETDDAAWRRVVETNLDASFYVLRAALRRMVPRGGGRVILVSSTGALRPSPDLAAYGAVKQAILHLVAAAAAETAGTGVTVNAVLPGALDTPENRRVMSGADPARFARPADVAAAAAFLASDDAAGVSGANVVVPAATRMGGP